MRKGGLDGEKYTSDYILRYFDSCLDCGYIRGVKEMKPKLKKFKVFYFINGDEFGQHEKRRQAIILAATEYEAEYIFKHGGEFSDCSFGWVEEA